MLRFFIAPRCSWLLEIRKKGGLVSRHGRTSVPKKQSVSRTDICVPVDHLRKALIRVGMMTALGYFVVACAAGNHSAVPSLQTQSDNEVSGAHGQPRPVPFSVARNDRGTHRRRPQFANQAPDTIDLCILAQQGAIWPCTVQNQVGGIGWTYPAIPSGASVAWSTPAASDGVTFNVSPTTTTTAPYNTYLSISVGPNASIGDNYTATGSVTVSAGSDASFCQNNFCGTTTYTTTYETLCSVSQNHCPVLGIYDEDGTGCPSTCPQIAGSPPPSTNTIVGEQINVVASPIPNTGTGSYTLSNPQWTVPTDTIKSWDYPSFDGNAPTMLASNDSELGTAQPSFYWDIPGEQDLIVQGTLTRADGEEISYPVSNAKFNATVPTGVKIASSGNGPVNPVIVSGTLPTSQAGIAMQYGLDPSGDAATIALAGITFDFAATAPALGSGLLVGAQLVNNCATVIKNNNSVPGQAGNGLAYYGSDNTNGFYLDTDSFYQDPVTVSAGKSMTLSPMIDNPRETNDAPWTNETQFTVDEQFEMYFLYEPNGNGAAKGNSIWVPLGYLTWGWDGVMSQKAPDAWTFTTGSSAPRVSVIETGQDFPTWPKVYLGGQNAPDYSSPIPNCSNSGSPMLRRRRN